jgi:hypothetical protein
MLHITRIFGALKNQSKFIILMNFGQFIPELSAAYSISLSQKERAGYKEI